MRFLLLILALCSTANAATLLNNFTAENGTVGQCAPAPLSTVTVNCVKVTDVKASSGTKSYDIFLSRNPGEMDNPDPTFFYRTEAKGLSNIQLDKTYAIRYDFYMDEWVTDTSSESWVGQIHETPSDWSKWNNTLVQPGDRLCVPSAYSSAPYVMTFKSGILTFTRHPGVDVWSVPIPTGGWHKIVIEFRASKGTTGFLNTWLDGVAKPGFIGKTHRSESDMPAYCGFTFIDDQLTMGIYKWDWKIGRPATQSTRRRGYLDNVMVAVEDGSPGTALAAIGGSGPIGRPADIVPPVISGLNNSNITPTSATVKWTTNESAKHTLSIDGVVYNLNNVFSTAPVFNVSGITSNAVLPYTITSTDAANNKTTTTGTLTTPPVPDTTPPVISGLSNSTITETTATVSWITNESAKHALAINGTTLNLNNVFSTSPVFNVAGLSASTSYPYSITSTDSAGNVSTSMGTVTTLTPVPTFKSLWLSTSTPTVADSGPDGTVELGLKFKSDVSGVVTGIRFYKAATNTGTHTGSLWSANGALLATATFSGESISGWQQVVFSTPVGVNAGVVYTTSYHTDAGHYAADTNFFAQPLDVAPLHGLGSAYAYGVGSYPLQSVPNMNYWVDVMFNPAPDTVKPELILGLPSEITDTAATVNWTTDEPASSRVVVDPATIPSMYMPALDTTHSIAMSGLLPETTYSYKVSSADVSGNLSEITSTFTTLAVPQPPVVPPTMTMADEFDSASMASKWTVYDPKSDSIFSQANGHFNIGVPAGSVHNMILTDTTAPRIVQAIPNADFDIYVKFDSLPTLVRNYTGVSFEKSPTEMLFFLLSSNGTNVAIEEKYIASGTTTLRNKLYLNTTPPKSIRVKRVGNVFTIYASNGDESWVKVDTFTFVQDINVIGLFTANWGSPLSVVTAFNSNFDYVRYYGKAVVSDATNQTVTHCVARIDEQTLPAVPVEVVANGKRCNIDITGLSGGTHVITTKFLNVDPVTGTAESDWSLPLTFSRPTI